MTFLLMKGKKNYIDEEGIMAFAEHFKKTRKKYKFTQESLAHASNITLSQIARIETGKINPSLSQLILFAETMGIPFSEFFDFEIKRKKKKK